MYWQGALSALAIGILVGIVRERRLPTEQSQAGLRTHALVAILGYVAWGLGVWPFMGLLAVVGALVFTGYRATAPQNLGLTGEVAVLVTLFLSALVQQEPALAVGLGVLVASLLEFKQLSHRLTREWITQQEIQDALVLAVAALVVMPLLPAQAIDPWHVLLPTTLWRIVVLVMAAGMVGHLAQRVLGLRWGLPVAGFCSGLVSSTAALVHLGHKARQDPSLTYSASASALLSNLASLLLMLGVIGAVSSTLLRAVAVPMAAACAALLAGALVCMWFAVASAATSMALQDSAFKLSHALFLALLMGGVSLLSAGLQAVFGDAGVFVTAVLVAIAEVHAAAASVAQMSLRSEVSLAVSAWSVLAVLAASAMAKTVLAFVSGGTGFGWRVGAGLAGMVGAAVLTLRWLPLTGS